MLLEVERLQLDIIGLTSTHRQLLERRLRLLAAQNTWTSLSPWVVSCKGVHLGTPKFFWGTLRRKVEETRRGMIDTQVSHLSGVLLLDICAIHTLAITNTMFEHKVVYKCTMPAYAKVQ